MKFNGKERAVVLQDVAFMAKVNADQARFSKGDWLEVNLKIVKTFLLTTVETKKTRLNGFLTLRSAAVSLHCFRILTALPGGLQNLPPAQKV